LFRGKASLEDFCSLLAYEADFPAAPHSQQRECSLMNGVVQFEESCGVLLAFHDCVSLAFGME